MMVHVTVEHVTVDHPEVSMPGFEVCVASDQGDFTFDVFVDKAIAEATADRLREMFEVLA